MNTTKLKRQEFRTNFFIDYQEEGNNQSSKAILLLHGYGQNSDIIKSELDSVVKKNEDLHWIIPNGIFPIPKVRNGNILYRFAWYFYNSYENRYFIDFKIPSSLLGNLINNNFPNKEITILGYSQGGYLAPFVGGKIDNIEHVIGINCNFRSDFFDFPLDYSLTHLHAVDDPLVEYDNACKSIELLNEKYPQANINHVKFDKGGHDMSEEIKDQINLLLTS